MPTRIIREGIITSLPVNALDWAEEVFYRRLLNIADDFGRFHGHPTLIRAACYPLKLEKVSDSDVEKWLQACVKQGLVSLYVSDGKRYLDVGKFGQQVRAKKSKYPDPAECKADAKQLLSKCLTNVPEVEDEDEDEDDISSAAPSQFHRFWDCWPKSPRKASRRKCGEVWARKRLNPLAEKIISHVEAMKESEQWRDAKFIPAPLTYLNQERWDGAEVTPDLGEVL